jgi:predicted transcriptional regulator
MEPSQARAVALFISIFLVVVPFAAADTGGYSTTPGLTGMVPDDHQDPVPISFWDLPLREMLIAVALSFCPVLVYPVELFFFLKLLTVLGYRKVEQNAVSYNEKRQKIYDCIAEHPGLNFNELERLTCVAEGTLKYHMLILGAKRKIVSYGTGRSIRYFENNGLYGEVEKKLFLYLQNRTTRRILDILATSREVSRKDLAERVGVAGPSISWHMKKLSGDGIITMSRKGKEARYTLCPAGVNIFKRYFGNESGMGYGSAGNGEEMGE